MYIPWNSLYVVVAGIFILLDVVLITLLIYSVTKAFSVRPRFSSLMPIEHRRELVFHDLELKRAWQRLKAKAEENPPQSFILAILDADKFVDGVLKRLGVEGEHMADRLERLDAQDFKTLDRLWRAHRVRNQLAHMPGFELTHRDAVDALQAYERFLEEVGIL